MMASRLLSMMLLLQAKGRLSASYLAHHFEVSERTVLRDIDQLSAAGIPVFSSRGRAGGFELPEGFRTKLTGLTQMEAETLFLSGVPTAASDLGLADLLGVAQLKLLAALPAGMPVERIAARFHLDTTAWFHAADKPEHLPTIARAVWDQKVLRMNYRREAGAVRRDVDPLGLVLKNGAWYLVARRDGKVLTYRASNVVGAEVMDLRFDPPSAFNLAEHWAKSAREYEANLNRTSAKVRLSPDGWRWLHLFGPHVVAKAAETVTFPDRQGWVSCELPLESLEFGVRDLLRLGIDVEVLYPKKLRNSVMRAALKIAAAHGATERT